MSRDAIIVGGGVIGCTLALHLARAGMRVALLEREPALCSKATSVNTGNISIMWTRPYLVPYAMRAREMWRTTGDWLGRDCGFATRGGLKLAFTEAEVAALETATREMRAVGAPVEMVTGEEARRREPALSDQVLAASWCALDGYADATKSGLAFAPALDRAGVEIVTACRVTRIERAGGRYDVSAEDGTRVSAPRLVVAGGVWIEQILALAGIDLPVICRVSMVSVTERAPPLFRTVLGAATGVLSLKQSDNGTVLIGGGWQGLGDPDRGPAEHVPDNLMNNLRLAACAVPAIRRTRLVRSWLGLEARVADLKPLAGPVPGLPDTWVVGAIDTGYTLGPYFGRLMAQRILGEEPEMPLFDPARLLGGLSQTKDKVA